MSVHVHVHVCTIKTDQKLVIDISFLSTAFHAIIISTEYIHVTIYDMFCAYCTYIHTCSYTVHTCTYTVYAPFFVCIKGFDGRNGVPGLDGDEGMVGEKGLKGELGVRGRNGEPGAPGIPGRNGDPGDKGEKGDMGFWGKRGLKGMKGEKGDLGDPGLGQLIFGPTHVHIIHTVIIHTYRIFWNISHTFGPQICLPFFKCDFSESSNKSIAIILHIHIQVPACGFNLYTDVTYIPESIYACMYMYWYNIAPTCSVRVLCIYTCFLIMAQMAEMVLTAMLGLRGTRVTEVVEACLVNLAYRENEVCREQLVLTVKMESQALMVSMARTELMVKGVQR